MRLTQEFSSVGIYNTFNFVEALHKKSNLISSHLKNYLLPEIVSTKAKNTFKTLNQINILTKHDRGLTIMMHLFIHTFVQHIKSCYQ